MTFQYGDLRVDEITYTSGGVNQTVTVSGLVANVNGAGGGTFDGNVTITGDLEVTKKITTNTITGNSANFTTITGQTATLQTISGDFINKYNSGVITQLTGSAIGYTTITGQTVTGLTANFVTVSGTTVTGDTVQGTSGIFINLSGQTITGDTVNVKSGVFSFITGADAHFGKLSADDIVFPGDETVNNFTVTGQLTANTIIATGISATVITGTTVTGNHAEFTSGTFQKITVTDTISGATVTGTNADFTTGTFQTIDGPIASSTVTGVTRMATTAEAENAAGPSGTYGDAITAPASAAINPSNLREALQAYDPLGPTIPAAFPAETGVYGREVITTGTFGVDGGVQIASITWKTISGLEDVGEPVTSAEGISAVAPSGTYTATVSGNANSQTFYNPATLRDTFKAYDPFPTGVGSTIFARTVEGVLDGGELVATGYEWIKIPTGTPAIATDNQAAAAAGASGTFSDTPIGGSVFINPENLRSAFKNYDPQPPAGTTRIYARSVSGLTATTTTGENWVEIDDILQGDFLPTTGGTVSGNVTITGQLTVGEQLVVQSQGLIVTGDVRHSGNTSMSGNLDVNGHINAQFNSAVNNVLYQVNGSAQRGIFQGPNAGVAVAKGGRQIVEFTSTGTGPAQDFALLSGDLRVGNNAQEVGNLNTSQFWAFERGNFASASDEESEIWRNREDDVKILTIKSSVGGNRTEKFGFGTSGQFYLGGDAGTSGLFVMSQGPDKPVIYSTIKSTAAGDVFVHDLVVTGNATFASGMTVTGRILGAPGSTITGFSEISATTGEFLELDVMDETNGFVRSYSGDFHSLVIGRPDIYGPFIDSPHLIVQGSGIFESGVFFTDNTDTSAMAIYGSASTTNSPNIVIGRAGVLGGATTRNSVAIGNRSQENASSNSDRNIAIGNNALMDMTDGHQNVVIGHGAAQNIRPGNNQGSNTVIGDNALFGDTAANNNSVENVVVGRSAMFDALQADANVAIGTQAGFNLITVSGNVLIGQAVALNGTTGDDNVFIGNQAAQANTASGNVAIGAGAFQSNTEGENNVALGRSALADNIDGDGNTAIGTVALQNNTGSSNTAVGRSTLFDNTTGSNNTAVGVSALENTTTGINNVAVGVNALLDNQIGETNVAVGFEALRDNTVSGNTAVGNQALMANTSGQRNVAVGFEALQSNTSGRSNTAIGFTALQATTSGNNNTAVGREALSGNITGSGNTAVGRGALRANITGAFNVGIGISALQNNTSGNDNTAIGTSSLLSNIDGDQNTAIGRNALLNGTSGDDNTAIGFNSLRANTATGNTAVGSEALLSNTSGEFNTAVGVTALRDTTTGEFNTAVGVGALQLNTSGSSNTALGVNALQSNTAGDNNVAIGRNSLLFNVAGDSNVAVGNGALRANVDADNNTSVGFDSLRFNESGDSNTAVGRSALQGNINGDGNTALGFEALLNSASSGNIGIGRLAGSTIAAGANNTIIGSVAGTAGMSDTIILAAGATQKVTVSGDNFTLTSDDGDDATFLTSSLTANRNYTLPDQAGTIALTSDIPGGDDNLTLHNLSVVNDDNVQVARISGDDSGSASFASGALSVSNVGLTTITRSSAGEAELLRLNSGDTINASFTNQGNVFLGGSLQQLSQARIQLSGENGSASFSSGITTIGAAGVSGAVRVGNNFGAASAAPNARVALAGSNTEGIQIVDNNSAVTTQLSWNGATSFASGKVAIADDGQLEASGTLGYALIGKSNSGPGANVGTIFGQNDNNTGHVFVGCKAGAVRTSFITSSGAASFASGVLTISNLGEIQAGVDPGDAGGTTFGATLSPFGLIKAQRGGTSNCIEVYDNDHAEPQSVLSADGSASFASGKVTVNTAGLVVASGFAPQGTVSQSSITTSGASMVFGTMTGGGGTAEIARFTSGNSRSLLIGGTTSATADIELNEQGVATFRGTNADGDTPQLILQSGIGGNTTINAKFNQFGTLYIGGNLAADIPASPNITLNANGNLICGGTPTDAEVGASMSAGGAVEACRSATNGAVFLGYLENNTDASSQIFADGSATFASGAWQVGAASDTLQGGVCQVNRTNALGGCFVGQLNAAQTSAILADGSCNFASGNVVISAAGALTATSANASIKSFRIDHPLPTLSGTHHLYHASIEGPQADLIYRGQETLVSGTATVNLDTAARMTEGTFVALNTNVSCFTSNETDWTAVRGSVSGNILTIEAQDNTSTASVSWMVVGERHDPTIKAIAAITDENGRLITEPLKPVTEASG